MRTITASELGRTSERALRELLAKGDMVVTRYGKPVAIMMPVTEENLEGMLEVAREMRSHREARAPAKRAARQGPAS